MMMNYHIVPDNEGVFVVIETRTDIVMGKHSSHKKAKEQQRFLNLGGGFDGHTPAFLMEKIKPFNVI